MLSVKQIKAAFVEYLTRKYPMMWIVCYVVDNKHLKFSKYSTIFFYVFGIYKQYVEHSICNHSLDMFCPTLFVFEILISGVIYFDLDLICHCVVRL